MEWDCSSTITTCRKPRHLKVIICCWCTGECSRFHHRFSWYGLVVPESAQGYVPYVRLSLVLLFVYNILGTLAPIMRPKDNLTDIPLTPTQRAALGLDPNVTAPPLPKNTVSPYITPPRYSRSPTPRKSSSGSRSRSPAGSPGSRLESSLLKRQGSDSSFSPSHSPLWQKAVGGNRDSSRQHSYGSPSPLGPGSGKDVSILGAPSTPSPSTGRGASVALNSKWLYERGRASPTSRNLYS